jgi:putative peptidoglycan lipid II flippase
MSTDAAPSDRVARDAATVSGITLLSRFFGLARDLLTARMFGDTAVGSAFAAAFAIPNTFRRLFGEGALSAAFIPEYTRLADGGGGAQGTPEPDADPGAFASRTLVLLTLFTGGLTLLIELGLLALVLFLPPDADRTLGFGLMMAAMPFMPLVCIGAILGGMLQAHGRFAVWAAAPIVLNVFVIAAAVPYFLIDAPSPRPWAYAVTVSAVLAAGVQVLWSLWALRGRVRWALAFSATRAAGQRVSAMLRRMGPALIGLGTLQINSLLDTFVAMWPNWVGPTIAGRPYPLDESSNSILFFAQRLYQFPLGVFGIAIATAAFPALSRTSTDPAAFSGVLRRGLRLSLFITLPASLGLIAVGPTLVGVLYSGPGGGFSAGGVERAAAVLAGYSVSIWAYSVNQLLTRAFYAVGDTRTPMRVAIAFVGVNIALNFTLIWPLREAGLAWATALCAAMQALTLGLLGAGRLPGGSALDRPGLISGAWSLALSIACAGAAWGVLVGAERLAPPGSWLATSWLADLVLVLAAVVVGGAVYLGLSTLARRPELAWARSRRV